MEEITKQYLTDNEIKTFNDIMKKEEFGFLIPHVEYKTIGKLLYVIPVTDYGKSYIGDAPLELEMEDIA